MGDGARTSGSGDPFRFVALVGVDGPRREEPSGKMFGENEVGRRVSRGQFDDPSLNEARFQSTDDANVFFPSLSQSPSRT